MRHHSWMEKYIQQLLSGTRAPRRRSHLQLSLKQFEVANILHALKNLITIKTLIAVFCFESKWPVWTLKYIHTVILYYPYWFSQTLNFMPLAHVFNWKRTNLHLQNPMININIYKRAFRLQGVKAGSSTTFNIKGCWFKFQFLITACVLYCGVSHLLHVAFL